MYRMLILPTAYAATILTFALLFSKRLFAHLQRLLRGAVLAPAPRTASAYLHVIGLAEAKQLQRYHHALNRARWINFSLCFTK